MSSGCGDVLSLEDLKTAKKHQTFEAEVITGHAGGVYSGSEIDFATNFITGQIQKTLPAILRDVGFDRASFDFSVGGSLSVTDRDKIIYNPVDNNWYSWSGSLPHIVAAGTDPTVDINWIPRTDEVLRADLAGVSGLSLVYGGHAPLSIIIPASVFQYMNETDLVTIRGSLGAEVVVDYALLAAINAGVTHLAFPPVLGRYVFSGTVTVPVGFNFAGSSSRPYTISGDSSFNNRGTVFKLAAGAPGLFTLTGRHTFTGIIFDGRDLSVGSVLSASQIAGLRFEQCGAYRWTRGFGRSSGYLGTLYARGCNASGNINAFYNLIDSKVIDSVANANTSHAVNLQSGANNNAFIGLRVEWNDGYGLLANAAVGNIFEGEMIDRNGLAGVCSLSGGVWLLGNAVVRRNGRLAGVGSSDNCHLRIEGSGSSLQFTNIRTSAGADDDGGGVITPEHALIATGSSTNMSVIGADSLMTGFTVAAINNIITPSARNFKNNNGINDTVTTGLSQHTNGRSFIGPDPGSIALSAAGTVTYAHSHQSLLTFSNPVRAVLDIRARNTTLNSAEYFRCILQISRVGSGNAVVVVIPVSQGNSSNWGLSSASPSGVSAAVTLSADASTVNVTLIGIDASARVITSSLKDL